MNRDHVIGCPGLRYVAECRCQSREPDPLTLDEYQRISDEFDFPCPTRGKLWFYALGQCDEAGEFAGKVKKHYRDGVPLDVVELALELGDVLWYLAAAAKLLGVSLGEVAAMNLEKLASRAARGKLGGSGDNR